MESAIKNAEKRVEETRPDPIQQALDQIEKTLKEEEAKGFAEDKNATSAAAGRTGKPASELKTIYHLEVAYRIKKNWVFPEELAGGETGLSNEVVVEVMRNGDIRTIWFPRRSGNDYLDDSAEKAIKKSSPLPPIPEGIPGRYVSLGFRFTPKGLD